MTSWHPPGSPVPYKVIVPSSPVTPHLPSGCGCLLGPAPSVPLHVCDHMVMTTHVNGGVLVNTCTLGVPGMTPTLWSRTGRGGANSQRLDQGPSSTRTTPHTSESIQECGGLPALHPAQSRAQATQLLPAPAKVPPVAVHRHLSPFGVLPGILPSRRSSGFSSSCSLALSLPP